MSHAKEILNMAAMSNGSVTFNGVSPAEFASFMELKTKHGDSLHFDPRSLSPIGQNYNNFQITWTTGPSWVAAKEAIELLLAPPRPPVQ